MNNQVEIPEIVKRELNNYILDKHYRRHETSGSLTKAIILDDFYKLPYDFQSGVYKAYLREKGIGVYDQPYANLQDARSFVSLKDVHLDGPWVSDKLPYQKAEIAAINAGLKLREQQLLENK